MNPTIFRALGLIGSLCVGVIGASALARGPAETSTSKAVRLASESVTVEYKCVGEETGINTLTGKERILPITFRIKISGKTATTYYTELSYSVTERDNAYILYFSIGDESKGEDLAGETTLQIDKDTGAFKETGWLLARGNVVTSRGKCELQDQPPVSLCDAVKPETSLQFRGAVDTVREMLAEGADVINMQCDISPPRRLADRWSSGFGTPLHSAIINSDPSTILTRSTAKGIIKLLLASGAYVNANDQNGRTPLHAAAVVSMPELALLLLKSGADVNSKDHNGRTPLHEAVSKPNIDLVRLLLAQGANVNVEDAVDADTPLHLAAEDNQIAIVEQLLAKGANVTAKNKRGKSPLDLATDPKVIALLKRYASRK